MYNTHPDQDINRAFLAFSIEIALIRIGMPQYKRVIAKLEKDYQTHLSDCDKNPEILKQVLQNVFGDIYNDILDEIRQELGDVCTKKYYADFLAILSK